MMRFALAPMDGLIKGLTTVVLAVPLVFVVLTVVAPGPATPILLLTLVGLLVVYGLVWFACRPSYVAVDSSGIHVRFPWWTRHIPAVGIRSVQRFPGRRYDEEVGWGLRVGVGGLWGVFGWLYTPIGWLEVYSTRISDVVLIRFEDRMPLLLSPAELDRFADAVEELASAAPGSASA